MAPTMSSRVAAAAAVLAALVACPVLGADPAFETYSVVCTEAEQLPLTRIAGMDSAATCAVSSGHVQGATAVARIARTMNTTGWDDYRSYVVDRSGACVSMLVYVARRRWGLGSGVDADFV
jgi:hypothetical protein